jgi:DNA-binding GntR family transcriptional regulator
MVQPLAREGLAVQITRHIRDQIRTGALSNGQALSSTRQMADEWNVSAKTINAALAPLVAEGLVISRDWAGRVVNAPDAQANLSQRVGQLEAEVAALRSRLDRLEATSQGQAGSSDIEAVEAVPRRRVAPPRPG